MSKTSAGSSIPATARAYWKRFAGSATGFARKYQTDPFFRTEANIITLQILFSLAIVAFAGAALTLLYQSTLSGIVAQVQENILNAAASGKETHLVPVPAIEAIGSWQFYLIVAAGIAVTAAFGYFIVRVALKPTKNALASQKQFIGNIAHELRTPLSTIKTNTEVRLMDAGIPQAVRELHQSTLEELDRISEIINNLLSLDTLVRPGRLEFSDVDLGRVVEKSVRDLSELARRKDIEIATRLSDFRKVWGNETALEQIVTNVTKNAVAYTPQGGRVAVTVSPDYRGAVILTVEDSGAGIAEKDLFRIFEPFYRGSSSRTRNDGSSGLGLAIVSELVRLHGGKIFVRSALKRGTTVTISLPAGEAPAQKAAQAADAKGHPQSEIAVDFSNDAPKSGA